MVHTAASLPAPVRFIGQFEKGQVKWCAKNCNVPCCRDGGLWHMGRDGNGRRLYVDIPHLRRRCGEYDIIFFFERSLS